MRCLGQQEVDFGVIMRKRLSVMGSTLRNRTDAQKTALVQNFWAWAAPYFADGHLKPMVWKMMPLSNVKAAHDLMSNNANAGKIVLTIN